MNLLLLRSSLEPVCSSRISWPGLILVSLTVVGHSLVGGPVTEWTQLQPFPTAAQARVLLHDGQTVVALCNGGVILRHASDGTWQQARTPATNELRSGLFGINRYVAVGDGGTVLISGDGFLWESKSSGTSANLLSVENVGSGLLAMGEGGTLIRSANGSDWGLLGTPTTQTLRAAAYGDGLSVVVGDAGTVLTSANGLEWTLAESKTTDDLREVVFGNGVFMARGSRWTVVSLDGSEWQAQQPQGPDYDGGEATIQWTLRGLAFGNGLFALSGYSTHLHKVQGASAFTLPSLFVTTNGFQWLDLQDTVVLASDPVGALEEVAFGDGVFVTSDPRGVFRSENGFDWNLVAGPALDNVRFESGRFLAVEPVSANPVVPNQMFTSRDGGNWEALVCEPAPEATRDLHGVVYANHRFVIAGDRVNLVSPDGLSWNWQFHEAGMEPHGIVSGNEVFVAVSPAGTLLTSTDGLEWEALTMTPPATFVRTRFLGDQFIAVGLAGAIASSPDGWNWVRRESGVIADLVDLATDGSRVVVVGDNGTALRSDDGAVWWPTSTTTTLNLLAVAWGNGRWLALAGNPVATDKVMWSTDGVGWSTETLNDEEAYLTTPLRFEGGQFRAIRRKGPPLDTVVGSDDGLHWNWAPGQKYAPYCGQELLDYIAHSDMTVAVSRRGYDYEHDWQEATIWVTAWPSPELEAEESRFKFELNLRSIAFGRGRFMVVGDGGVILASNPIDPVLALEVDPSARRLRLTLAGAAGQILRLEFSTDLAEWSDLGTYTAADSPLWFDLPSGSDSQSGFYRAVVEPEL
jgi:hypothetical protein